MRRNDISFALTVVLHAMSPPNVKTALSGGQNLKAATEIRTGSLTFTGTRDTKTSAKINTSLYQVSFLGNRNGFFLQILFNDLICSFENNDNLFRG